MHSFPSTPAATMAFTMKSISQTRITPEAAAQMLFRDATPPQPADLTIVRETWRQVSQTHHESDPPCVSPPLAFAMSVYEHLFRANPEFRLIFTNEVQQSRALVGMLFFVTNSFKPVGEDPTTYAPEAGRIFRELGARHHEWGVRPEMFQPFIVACLAALGNRLGDEYSPKTTGKAWETVFYFVASQMILGLKKKSRGGTVERGGSLIKRAKRKSRAALPRQSTTSEPEFNARGSEEKTTRCPVTNAESTKGCPVANSESGSEPSLSDESSVCDKNAKCCIQ
ncbi:hypothetical protein BC937DRAFT_87723 [Endogone sp. FLAS-F59071]|nr:hypothetical protein BC937DRAFT_87723 [Endogone sp. FLAS-F59071]|eukprot:RUS12499.1 hypothetical protein BC937DRAFT_87723 [Endogone sp. FLAS-F59071]